jgi:hypothetical protein
MGRGLMLQSPDWSGADCFAPVLQLLQSPYRGTEHWSGAEQKRWINAGGPA